ncbi:MAG: metallophosphoesterase [Sulfurovum sp.]|nr:metallophosphoesterase [Sulfurovum sp.]
MSQKSLRILHFSDIHVSALVRHMKWRKWFSKCGIGAINLLRGRAKYFDDVEKKMAAMVRFKKENSIDIVINTGDYTALGLEHELIQARKLMEPMMYPSNNYLTVPGNHDIYVHERNSHHHFVKQFGSVLQSDLPEYCVERHYPLVRLIDDGVAVIALNSSKPNPQPWRSDGYISHRQLESFKKLLQDKRIRGRFLFVITHYAPRLADGKPDRKRHGLCNANDFLYACSSIEQGAILFGHVHQTYYTEVPETKIPLYCAGSATMKDHEGAWVYELEGNILSHKRVYWNGRSYGFNAK